METDPLEQQQSRRAKQSQITQLFTVGRDSTRLVRFWVQVMHIGDVHGKELFLAECARLLGVFW